MVSDSQAVAIREMVNAYLVPDKFTLLNGNHGYGITSLYLDSLPQTFYRQTQAGAKNRVKLRMRFYDHAPDAPVFVEIKRRSTEAVLKNRAAITKKAAERILAGIRPTSADLISPSSAAIHDLNMFVDLCERYQADGHVYVGYSREAFMSTDDNSVRVTFDRHIMGYRYDPHVGLRVASDPCATNLAGVVLEFKFTGQFPNWMSEMAQLFGLQRRSVPKYVMCVESVQKNDPLYLAQRCGA